MSILTRCRWYIFGFFMGGAIGVCGFTWRTWEFWVLDGAALLGASVVEYLGRREIRETVA